MDTFDIFTLALLHSCSLDPGSGSLPLVVGKYFVLWLIYYVFPYHETGLLKWLPANEGCPAKSEVLLVGFCTRLYGDNLAISEGYILLPNTATLIARLSQ